MKILLRFKYTRQQRIMLLQQLAVILQSGLPLLRGMELLQQRTDKNLRLLCYRLQQRLQRGSTLAEAMAAEPDFFAELTVKLTAAGEESGALKEVLEQTAAYYVRQEDLRRFVVKAAVYPAFLLLLSLAVLLFFLLYLLPVLAEAYLSMGIRPEGILKLLLQLHAVLTNYAGAVILTLATLLLAAAKAWRRLWHWLQQHWGPGNFYSLLYEVRFCRLGALLLDSGMSVTRAIGLIAAAMDNEFYRRQLHLLNSRLRRGLTIEEALAGMAGIFSPLTIDLLSVGAATGCLPQMLRQAAAVGEQEVTARLSKFKELLTPLLLLGAGLLIGAVVCAVVGPLFAMLAAMPEYN